MLTAGTYRGTDLMQRGASVIFKPQAQVFAEALVTARALADKPAYTLRTLKQTLARRKLEQLPAILAEELRMHAETFGNPEVKRRIAQFIRIEESEGAPTTPTVPAPATPSAVSDAPSSNGRVRLKSLVPSKTLTPSLQAISLEKTELTQVRLERIEDTAVVVPAGSFADEEVRGYLTESLCETLHLEDGALSPQASFRDLGLDSVTGVEFVHGVNRAFGLHLDASIVYDHVHLDALSAYVIGLVKKNREIAAQQHAARRMPHQ